MQQCARCQGEAVAMCATCLLEMCDHHIRRFDPAKPTECTTCRPIAA